MAEERTLRLLMLSAYFEAHRSGIEIIAGRLGREFVRLGWTVSWAAAGCSQLPPEEAATQAIPLHSWNWVERFTGIPLPVPSPTALMRLFAEVRRTDVVHLHDGLYLANIAAFVMARLACKPVIITQHIGLVPYRNVFARSMMSAANRLLVRPMLGLAEQVVYYSETAAAYFRDVAVTAKPVFIPNGVDTGIFKPADAKAHPSLRARFGLPLEAPIVLFVGRFVEKKGMDAMECLARRRPDLTIALAGWGPVDPAGWNLPNVHIMSGLSGPELAELYQASDVFVLPSVGEGFPLVIQEALACGLPVICGQESAKADAAARPFLRPISIQLGSPQVTARDLAIQIDAARVEPAEICRKRAEFAAASYDWRRAGLAYDALLRELVERARCQQSAPKTPFPLAKSVS